MLAKETSLSVDPICRKKLESIFKRSELKKVRCRCSEIANCSEIGNRPIIPTV